MPHPDIEALRRELAQISRRIDLLESRLASDEAEPVSTAIPEAALPPPLPVVPLRAEPRASTPPPPPTAPAAPAAEPSIELHLGQVWLVRVGIGMLLAGLVFLASFTYQHLIVHITPFGRASALFGVSLALSGLGLWLERTRETLRYYGRVLGAGGLAGAYYSLYASHHVRELRWIEGDVAGNLVLMAWSAVMVAVACRRRSQVLGAVSIALAYYASLIGPGASYTLTSNLILAAAAVFLTVRYGWQGVTWTALLASYGAYMGTHFFSNHGTPFEAWMVAGYWVLFTFGALWKGTGGSAALLTVNNALYLLAGYASLPWHGDRSYPNFAMTFGGILFALALVPALRRSGREDAALALLVEGIVVGTLGWMVRWHGTHAALILGVEGGLLLLASVWSRNTGRKWALRILGHGAATLAFVFAWGVFSDAILRDGPAVPLLTAALLSVVGIGALFLSRLRGTGEAADAVGAGYLVSLALVLYLTWVFRCVEETSQFWVLVVTGAVLFTVQFVRPFRFVNALCAVVWGVAVAGFFWAYGDAGRLTWANGLALAGLLALSQAARRIEAPYMSFEGRLVWLSASAVTAWDFVGEKLHLVLPDFSPTLAWALLGGIFFALGLAARERIARWWGLGLLAAALGRVAVVDAWQLGTLSRIFTFLGLGAILLILGFVYNRYQEALRKWL